MYMETKKITYDIPDVNLDQERNADLLTKFSEIYKIKDIPTAIPTYAPKNEQDCYVRYLDGSTYKLAVYCGKTTGWLSTTLS